MRKIVVEIELPEDIEADYTDVHPQLVIEDLFPSQIGFRVVSDTAQQSAQSDLLPCGHPESSWRLGGCGEGCVECANAAYQALMDAQADRMNGEEPCPECSKVFSHPAHRPPSGKPNT